VKMATFTKCHVRALSLFDPSHRMTMIRLPPLRVQEFVGRRCGPGEWCSLGPFDEMLVHVLLVAVATFHNAGVVWNSQPDAGMA
jgi:hypothetical protein